MVSAAGGVVRIFVVVLSPIEGKIVTYKENFRNGNQ